jgi:hypothetical protein
MDTPSIDYQMLAAALLAQANQGIRQKTVSSTPTTVYGHGPSGLFSTRGLSQPLFSALLLPQLGLQSILPVKKSLDANPLYGIFTGVTATTGSEPTGVCDDPPVAGMSKLCTHSFVFGRQARMTRVFELDRLGLRTNRAEFDDLQLRGNPFMTGAEANVPTMPGMNLGTVAQKEVSKALFELAVAWSRDFAVEFYTGNPTNNTAGGGRKYFYGMDILINTGYRDAETTIACPAADSIVRSFGNLNISTAANQTTLVSQITNIYRNLRFISSRAGLDPVKWTLAMTWALFYEITAIWPCAYQTYRCSVGGTNNTAFSDRDAMNKMTDDMRGDIYTRTGQYLLIDGERVEVIIDDAIAETVGAGEVFTSAIYFVPLTVLGGEPVTYFEYKPQDGEVLEGAQAFAPEGSFYASDGGRFLWGRRPPELFCTQLVAKTEPRLLLLTPHLAARLTNIVFSPLVHQRGWQTTDTSFYVDGGRVDAGGYGPSYASPSA